MVHELKTDKDVFMEVYHGRKTYEIRFNDRKFRLGDYLWLRETQHTGEEMKDGKPLIYSGYELVVRITHILEGRYGLKEGWCILSISSLVAK